MIFKVPSNSDSTMVCVPTLPVTAIRPDTYSRWLMYSKGKMFWEKEMSRGGVILSVFIVSNNAIFRHMISGIVLLFLSSASPSLPSLPPPKEPSLGKRLLWGNRKIYTQHLFPLAAISCQSKEATVSCRAPLDDARNRKYCLLSFKQIQSVTDPWLLGLSSVLFWVGVNLITAGIKLIIKLYKITWQRGPQKWYFIHQKICGLI